MNQKVIDQQVELFTEWVEDEIDGKRRCRAVIEKAVREAMAEEFGCMVKNRRDAIIKRACKKLG